MGAPKGMWECMNCGDYNPDYVSECQNCHQSKDGKYSSSSSSYGSTSKGTASRKNNCFTATGSTGSSSAATFFTVCAWFIWIAGLICALVLSFSTEIEYGYYSNSTKTVFNFGTFIVIAAAVGVGGATYYFLAELFQNIANIAASLRDMKIEQTEYKEAPLADKLASDVAFIADTLRAMHTPAEAPHDQPENSLPEGKTE